MYVYGHVTIATRMIVQLQVYTMTPSHLCRCLLPLIGQGFETQKVRQVLMSSSLSVVHCFPQDNFIYFSFSFGAQKSLTCSAFFSPSGGNVFPLEASGQLWFRHHNTLNRQHKVRLRFLRLIFFF